MALTAIDKQILETYKNNQDRYSYWNYLVQKGDPYAKLALGVVTNETVEGYVANQYAASRAAELGKTLTAEQWWKIGVDIMAADYAARTSGDPTITTDGGSTLRVNAIAGYHALVFSRNGLDKFAWTAQIPLNDALLKGDVVGAQAIWNKMLDNGLWYGMWNDPLVGLGLLNDSNVSLVQATAWLGKVTGGIASYT